ncbi:histidine phosphatase family protein [Cellulomonas sp. zg-ZUI222]|uniref:Histidine phosphatase family protein n=1 Tax=Cellulomonas wangleii TaxID=2816956 RepID=A0ABX8D5B5_9CELL|nr:histidine phosphatase family protein [Cellulomonas wangleii]MBO0922151.1 histidine phosphatase family protein [Cellulomonas wangleii]MBO0926130.1 histidine phosphatase family protein [Cellulomonas wangleii]QVI62647.1 histidine phosphatase family protein [Cellulomonas wangleii]
MATRHLYVARHGEADALGTLTATGRRQAALLGERLARVPVTAVWHSPLPRAVVSAHEVARHLPGVAVAPADELVDHVPHVPAPADVPRPLVGFFDGFDTAEAAAGRRTADALAQRFAAAPAGADDVHEVLVTHAYQVAWLVRHALDAPDARWIGLESANAALTVLEYRPDLPPTLVTFNDQSHLPPGLRWTGFPGDPRV